MAARNLGGSALARVFNAGFAEYVVPLQMSEEALTEHVDVNDIDLGCSRVLADPEPIAFALVGRRSNAAWIGGMGIAPSRRGQGLGERTLRSAIDAAAEDGATSVSLEVIDRNRPAIALYEKLGFEPIRDLIIWTLPSAARDGAATREDPGIDAAHAWIAAHRRSEEPWQRTDGSLVRLIARGTDLRARAITRDGETVAAVITRSTGATAGVVQVCALDAPAATDVLGAALAEHKELRISNVPAEDPLTDVLGELGARALIRQHELRLVI